MNPQEPTAKPQGKTPPIAERTRSNYLQAIKTAVKSSVAKRTTDWEEPAIVSLTEVVTDFFARDDLAASTRNLQRSAFLWYIRSEQTEPNRDTEEALAFLENMEAQRGPRVTRLRPNTISKEDLGVLLEVLYDKAPRSAWAFRAATWIQAGLACGARPIEWLGVEWVDAERTAVQIRSAKVKLSAPAFLRKQVEENTAAQELNDPWQLDALTAWEINGVDPDNEGRSLRAVPIDNDQDRDAIDAHLALVNQIVPLSLGAVDRETEFVFYHRYCSQAIDRACKLIWGGKKPYSLYTMRGQFAANVKAAKGAAVAAELMGHSSADSPSTGHYGKGNQAHPQFKGTRKSPVTEQLNQRLAQHRAPTQGEARGPMDVE